MSSLQTVAKSDLLCNYHCRLSLQTPRCLATLRSAPFQPIRTSYSRHGAQSLATIPDTLRAV